MAGIITEDLRKVDVFAKRVKTQKGLHGACHMKPQYRKGNVGKGILAIEVNFGRSQTRTLKTNIVYFGTLSSSGCAYINIAGARIDGMSHPS